GLYSLRGSKRMPRIPFVLILIATAALAQKVPQQTAPKSPSAVLSAKKSTAKIVAPTDPVITIQGLCSSASKPASGASVCKTTVSRRDFEIFLNALSATTRGVEPS